MYIIISNIIYVKKESAISYNKIGFDKYLKVIIKKSFLSSENPCKESDKTCKKNMTWNNKSNDPNDLFWDLIVIINLKKFTV